MAFDDVINKFLFFFSKKKIGGLGLNLGHFDPLWRFDWRNYNRLHLPLIFGHTKKARESFCQIEKVRKKKERKKEEKVAKN